MQGCTRPFLSTLSLRRATQRLAESQQQGAISIHALLAESDLNTAKDSLKAFISIHALLAESDLSGSCRQSRKPNFYPRSPCGERRSGNQRMLKRCLFLSTLSLRRATGGPESRRRLCADFYPRSPCGERRKACRTWTYERLISIHALLAESDRLTHYRETSGHHFYPRSPCGERRSI